MTNVGICLRLALGALLACFCASASTSFDFTGDSGSSNVFGGSPISGYNNQYSSFSDTISGLTKVTVYALGTGNNPSSTLTSGTVGQWGGYGLGDCNRTEGAGCSAPQHQVDNNGQTDFMLFVFSTPVDLSTITLTQFTNAGGPVEMDMSYWLGTAGSNSLSLSSLLANGVPTTGQTNDLCTAPCGTTGNDGLPTITDNISGNDITYLLVSAAYGSAQNGTSDFFKIESLNTVALYTSGQIGTPEPASFALIGLALAGLGIAGKRRKRRARQNAAQVESGGQANPEDVRGIRLIR